MKFNLEGRKTRVFRHEESSLGSGLPALPELVFDPKMIENAGDDGVHGLLDGAGAAVEAGAGGNDGSTGFGDNHHVAEMDQVVRCFARNKDQPAAFFEEDIRGARDRVVAG